MSALNTSAVRPGLLVSMKTGIRGNMKYSSTPPSERQEGKAQVTTWETTRVVTDKAEHERAVKTRSKVRSFITGVCIESPYGLLCPLDREAELSTAIDEARKLSDSFNDTARHTFINFNLIVGRIAENDEEAFRAITGEVRDLMKQMEAGIKNLDATAIRTAATKARAMGQMLSLQARDKVREAIDVARAAARKISKAGEEAAKEIDHEAIAAIGKRRTAFLDMSEIDDEPAVIRPRSNGRAVSLTKEEPAEPASPRARVRVNAMKGEEAVDKMRAKLNGRRPRIYLDM